MIPSSKCIGKCNTADAVFLLERTRPKRSCSQKVSNQNTCQEQTFFLIIPAPRMPFVLSSKIIAKSTESKRQQQKLSICLIIFLHKSLNKFPKGRARWLFSSFLVFVGTWNFCLKGAVVVVSMSKVLLPFVKERESSYLLERYILKR